MKNFITKILIFIIPFLLILIISIIEDPYKVFNTKTYFPADGNILELNASVIKTELYLQNRGRIKNYDSFIFGNSRSDAFKCESWKKFLPNESNPFHFEGMGENLFGVYKKIKFIDLQGDTIKNALIILDEEMLGNLNNIIYPPYITHYKVSEESMFVFYWQFIKIFYKPKFLISYYDFKINKKYKPYMKKIIPKFKYRNQINLDNGDFKYSLDKEIKRDSISYYNNLKRIIIRDTNKINYKVSEKEIFMHSEITKIFDKHKTNYKIILSPLYNQIPFSSKRKLILDSIYKPNNIFDFTGINEYTEKIGNYYEASHYRPIVANQILKEIYFNKK